MKILAADQVRLWDLYEQGCLELGMRAGDVKPTSLDLKLDWSELLAGCDVGPVTRQRL